MKFSSITPESNLLPQPILHTYDFCNSADMGGDRSPLFWDIPNDIEGDFSYYLLHQYQLAAPNFYVHKHTRMYKHANTPKFLYPNIQLLNYSSYGLLIINIIFIITSLKLSKNFYNWNFTKNIFIFYLSTRIFNPD